MPPPPAPPLRIAGLVLTVIASAFVGLFALYWWGSNLGATWVAIREPGLLNSPESLRSALDSVLVHPSLAKCDLSTVFRARQQAREVAARKHYHAALAVFFYSRHNAALNVAPFLVLLAAAMGALVVRKGWEESTPYLRAAFIVSVAMATYFSAYPQIFKQDDNATANARSYVQHSDLADNIATYLAVSHNGATFCRDSLAKYLNATDKAIAALNTATIGFDISKVPSATPAFDAGK